MNNLLKVLQHLCFVICGLLFLKLILTGNVSFESFKGTKYYSVEITDATTSFEDSYVFNSMFGNSISDILDYGSLNNRYETTPELRNSVSANSIGASNVKPDLSKYGKFYDYGNTNLDFFIIADFAGKTDIFDNLNLPANKASDFRNRIFEECGPYLYYDSVNNEFDTNTKITQETVIKLIGNSGYGQSDGICLMVGLNKGLNFADSYKEAGQYYNDYTKYCLLEVIVCAISFIVMLVIVVLRTVLEGRVVNKETRKISYKLALTDSIPCEIRILMMFMCFLLIVGVISLSWEFLNELLNIYKSQSGTIAVVCLTSLFLLICSLICGYFYYGFVRRLKCKVIWKGSLLNRLWIKLKDVFEAICNNRGAFFNSLAKVGIISVINILFTFFVIMLNKEQIYIGGIAALFILLIIDFEIGSFFYKNYNERMKILEALKKIAGGDVSTKIDEEEMHFDNSKTASVVNQIGEAVNKAVETSMKDEKMKTDLITNVSHDLKTPLTSIINYVDLLKRENITDEPSASYIKVLDEKSQRLKQLTDDLVEASKISSGNLVLSMERIGVKDLISQAVGEFSDRFEEKNLGVNISSPEDNLYISADSRSIFRVIENLFINIYKYAMENTRVYIDLKSIEGRVQIVIKNISSQELNVNVDELMERFVRGDEARSSEGSGLGLSIARSLTEAMGGKFEIVLDGDLFKVVLSFAQIS